MVLTSRETPGRREVGGATLGRRGGASVSAAADSLGPAEPLGEVVDSDERVAVTGDALRGALACVEDGGVVAPSELLPDRGQARVGELAGQVHRHLPRPRDAARARGG